MLSSCSTSIAPRGWSGTGAAAAASRGASGRGGGSGRARPVDAGVTVRQGFTCEPKPDHEGRDREGHQRVRGKVPALTPAVVLAAPTVVELGDVRGDEGERGKQRTEAET